MMSFFVSFHVGCIDAHEIAFGARHRLGRMRLFYVGVKHELLGVVLSTRDALEGSMNAVSYSQMRNQSSNEMEFLLT